jgi:iron complex outermembrane receptor protein
MSKSSANPASVAARAMAVALVAVAPGVAEAQGIEEVVVTAQRREQSVQDVGIAVSAFSADQMQQLGLRNSTDLQAHTPGLIVGNVTGSSGIILFNIRGVNQNDFNDQNESPIAVYQDDAYVASMTAAGFTMFDLDRVEVLKGPQGTLFGRNTTGGLLHFISAAPTETFSGHADLTLASYDQVQFEAAVSGPLLDNLLARTSVAGNFSDGY